MNGQWKRKTLETTGIIARDRGHDNKIIRAAWTAIRGMGAPPMHWRLEPQTHRRGSDATSPIYGNT